MNKPSINSISLIPKYDELKQLCVSISVLEAIICPEWEYRYYSYQKKWAEGEELFEIRNGSGSQMLILFNDSGVCINGLAYGFKAINNTFDIPEEFKEFMLGEPVKSIGATFCVWQLKATDVWENSKFYSPGNEHDDGSDVLLKLLDGNPLSYTEWANDYYQDNFEKRKLQIEDVALIYEQKVLTEELVRRINPSLVDFDELIKEVKEIEYPCYF